MLLYSSISQIFCCASAVDVKVIFILRLREVAPRQVATVVPHIMNRYADLVEAFDIGNEPNVFT